MGGFLNPSCPLECAKDALSAGEPLCAGSAPTGDVPGGGRRLRAAGPAERRGEARSGWQCHGRPGRGRPRPAERLNAAQVAAGRGCGAVRSGNVAPSPGDEAALWCPCLCAVPLRHRRPEGSPRWAGGFRLPPAKGRLQWGSARARLTAGLRALTTLTPLLTPTDASPPPEKPLSP